MSANSSNGSALHRPYALHIRKRMYSISTLQARVSQISQGVNHAKFSRRMKLFPNTIDRDSPTYARTHYRAHWQPLWAIMGLVLCPLLVITQGWAAVYDLCAHSKEVSKEDSIVDLVFAYLGVSSRSLSTLQA